ncbi:MAG: DUF3459 domain-containing protein [Deinococcus-Thermus bacterium]|jgi:alpha-glucosidase|nr:DUF3459 domain-containing protein [Deinococcota bacterium]
MPETPTPAAPSAARSAAPSAAPSASDPRPWWRGAVIYQIYPRSFFDSNGDGIGDLPGVIARLDHIAGLGVDAIWLSPFFASPMKDFGYDVADYRRVDPMFGSDADFDRLVAEAHDRGLKVLIDMILPHCSDRHAWFQESRQSRDNPKADWFVWADPRRDGTAPNNWLSIFGGPAWTFDPLRGQYYWHCFLKQQPNLNWHNPDVVEAMLGPEGEVAFWLDRGVDGLRLDAITTLICDAELRDNPPATRGQVIDMGGVEDNPFTRQMHLFDRDQPEILDRFRRLRALCERYGERYTMAEIGDVDAIPVGSRYTAGEGLLHSYYMFQLTHDEIDSGLLHRVVGRTESLIGDGWTTYTLGNHDTERTVTRFGRDPELAGDGPALAKLMLALVTSLRGGACLYQGDELGLTEADLPFEQRVDPFGLAFWPVYKGRDGCRTPMPWTAGAPHAGFTTGTPWLPVPAQHHDLAVDRQAADPGSVLEATRAFLAWRKTHPVLITGDKRLVETAAPVFAVERTDGDARMLCVFNLSNRPATATLDGGWRTVVAPGPANGTIAPDGTVTLPPFGVVYATT